MNLFIEFNYEEKLGDEIDIQIQPYVLVSNVCTGLITTVSCIGVVCLSAAVDGMTPSQFAANLAVSVGLGVMVVACLYLPANNEVL